MRLELTEVLTRAVLPVDPDASGAGAVATLAWMVMLPSKLLPATGVREAVWWIARALGG